MISQTSRRTFWLDIFFLFVVLGGLFTFNLGNRPLATPDEARYVEISREMVVTGDYLTPRLNGIKYFEKPPLFYWLQAASIKAFDLKEGAMRLWVVFFALFGCLATYSFGRRHFDLGTGFVSAFILGTSALYFCLGRLIILDMAVSILVTLILYSFYQAVNEPIGLKRRLWFYSFSTFCALGVLTKGIMALAIPGPIIIIWATLAKQWRNIFPVYLGSSLAIFLAISVPWHVLVSLKNPEFAYKYFIVEHFMRYTTDVHLRYKPIWFFIPIILVGFLPWSAFIPKALKDGWVNRKDNLQLFLILWAGWVFGFFSISNSKLIPYILPMFPPIALLIGKVAINIWRQGHKELSSLYTYAATSITLCLAGGATTYFFPSLLEKKSELLSYIYILMGIFFVSGCIVFYCIRRLKFSFGEALVLNAVESLGMFYSIIYALRVFFIKIFRMRPAQVALSIISLSSVLIALTMAYAVPHIQRPSIKPLVEIIQKNKKPGDKVVSFMAYYQDLPVYAEQTVMVVEAKSELEFGTTVEDTTSWMVKEQQFLELWKKGEKMWVIGRKTELEHLINRHPDFQYVILANDHGNILFTQR